MMLDTHLTTSFAVIQMKRSQPWGSSRGSNTSRTCDQLTFELPKDVWFDFNRSIAMTRSSGVRNQAV